ncbi:hypothetical protein ATANTOWER_013631 [Ataeniobius toweri]|uniref:Uncharacterized protein n=1 Tax=Ataeniobius toweri TaxID=208326 RepID=A0ABU7C7F3_9TELE|nr:hypothetical protein [Ataeniobius toweri]
MDGWDLIAEAHFTVPKSDLIQFGPLLTETCSYHCWIIRVLRERGNLIIPYASTFCLVPSKVLNMFVTLCNTKTFTCSLRVLAHFLALVLLHMFTSQQVLF